MTQAERNQLAQQWILTAKYFDKVLDYDLVKMLVDDVCHHKAEDVSNALRIYRKGNSRAWPRSSDIIAILEPKRDDTALAIEAAGRCVQAVKKFGWTNPEGAREFIGEMGWLAVVRYGGWKHICENLGSKIDQTSFVAQVRDLCKSNNSFRKQGFQDGPIGLPESDSKVGQLVSKLSLDKSVKDD